MYMGDALVELAEEYLLLLPRDDGHRRGIDAEPKDVAAVGWRSSQRTVCGVAGGSAFQLGSRVTIAASAAIHTVLKRLRDAREVDFVELDSGKFAYEWQRSPRGGDQQRNALARLTRPRSARRRKT